MRNVDADLGAEQAYLETSETFKTESASKTSKAGLGSPRRIPFAGIVSDPYMTPSDRIDEALWETDDDPLILWMLSLSSTERLAVAQGFVDSVRAFRDAARPDEVS